MTGGREGFSFGAGWATCFTCAAPSRSIDERAFISPRLDIQSDLRLGAPRAAHAVGHRARGDRSRRRVVGRRPVHRQSRLGQAARGAPGRHCRPRNRRSSTVRSTNSARMLDDWQITFDLRDLPPEVWDFLKANKFFAMIIPKQYGGLGFSAYRAFRGDPQAVDALDLRARSPPWCRTRSGRASCCCSSAPRRSRITGCRGSPTRARSPASGSPARKRARMPRR